MEGAVISIKLEGVYLFDNCDSENLLDDSDQQQADANADFTGTKPAHGKWQIGTAASIFDRMKGIFK